MRAGNSLAHSSLVCIKQSCADIVSDVLRGSSTQSAGTRDVNELNALPDYRPQTIPITWHHYQPYKYSFSLLFLFFYELTCRTILYNWLAKIWEKQDILKIHILIEIYYTLTDTKKRSI